MKLAIFKKGENKPLTTSGDDGVANITGLTAETNVAAGDYQAALTDGSSYGAKIDVPAFKTLPDYVAKGTAAGKADGDAGKDAADNSSKSEAYQTAYTAAYTPAKAAYDAANATTSGFDPAGDTKPTDANTVADITAWLDAHSIDHTGKTLKADLLALVPAD